jgi:HTH-type transcriptional regulator, transcriptional repressor of NAD biosynthesis genes
LEKNKRYRKGFVLGKFMPLHKGHLFMIHSAMELVDELTILVCSIKNEPIDGELRFKWMKESVKDANIIHVTDEVPSYPHEHVDFWNIWTNLLQREIDSETEVFFSSESYGDEVAERLGIQHVIVDQQRLNIPISGSEIRNNPFKNWDFIPDVVKPYFTKRIVLTGPESTGKTTLTEKLAIHYKTSWAKEFGRDYFVEKEGNLNIEDITNIAIGQVSLEETAIKNSNRIAFFDTDLIVTQIWSEIYFQECPQKVIEMTYQRDYDLYLLMDIDIPWEDDGTREFPNLRQWHFDRIKTELENRGLKYIVISGDFEERFKLCIEAVESILFEFCN